MKAAIYSLYYYIRRWIPDKVSFNKFSSPKLIWTVGVALTVFLGILSIPGFSQSLVFSSTNPAVSSANLAPGSVKQPIYRAVLVASGGGGNLTQVTFTPSGTFASSDISKYQFWYNTTDNLSTASTNGPDVTTIPASNNLVTFLVYSPYFANATYYMWITADISAGATSGHTLTVAALTTSNFTISPGTKSGTMYIGGTQTINAPVLWYNVSWLYRKAITIDYTKVISGAHTDFPVLISITDTDLQTKAQSDADDILFIASDGTTKLSHEIESYTSASGILVTWVKIPSLSSSANTVIYMYYGNAAATSQQNVTGTWNTNFKGVYHLNNAFTDATSNANNGTNTGTTNVTGKISNGRGYVRADGSDYITINGFLGSPTSFTLSAWATLTTADPNGSEIISMGDNALLRYDEASANRTSGVVYNGSGVWTTTGSGINYAGTGWHYVVYTFDNVGHSQKLYVDGVQIATSSSTACPVYTSGGTNTFIGKHGNANVNFDFDGTIDEARVANTSRSLGWVRTEYYNQNSPSTFYAVGAETYGVPTLTLSTSSLSGYSYCLGSGPSSSQSFTISASGLTGSGNITVPGPTNYNVSTDNTNFYTSVTYPFASGIITGQPKTVYVRLKAGLSANNYNSENITFSGGGLSSPPTVSNNGTVYAIPASPTAGNNGPLCTGSTLSLTASTISGATYSWTGPNSYTSSSQNPTVSTSATTAMTGTYYVTATVNGCSGSAGTTAVTVSDAPNISQVPANSILYYKFSGNANDEAGTNNGTLQNNPTLNPDRFAIANRAYVYNGSTQYVSTTYSYANPTNFTVSIWFKTATTSGGKLIGFGNAQTGSSASYDRHIYMNNAGQLYFGVYTGAVVTIYSPLTYNDNKWHLVTATLSGTSGMVLYIDGAQVASNANTIAQSYTGYWRIGYDNINAWPSQPSSFYFNGMLDDALVYHTALNSTQVATLYNSPDGAGNYGAVCAGSILNLTATTVSGATYSWTGPNGFTSSSQNPSFTYSSGYEGIYTVQVILSGGCSSTAYTAVSTAVSPPASISYAGSPYCSGGGNASVTLSGTTGGTFSSTSGLSINSTSGEINLGSSVPATYTVSYTVTVGCTTIATTAVTINYSPIITGTSPGSRTGPGTVVLGASASAGTINWYSTSTGGSSLGTGTSFTTPYISTTTTYYVDATYNGCTSSTRTAVLATVVPVQPTGPAASWNYLTQAGVLGTSYSWIDCTSGSNIVSGDDAQAQINWPFNFSFYDNSYTSSNLLSVATNGFIRLDGVASTDYAAASAYDLTSTATGLGQIIAMAVYDDNISSGGGGGGGGGVSGWVRYLVTGTAPNRIFTIEYNNLEIDYNDSRYADVQVSFYESINKIVLKFGTDNIIASGVDMGIHSGVNTFFNKWQEVYSGTNNTWIEYTPPYLEVNATIGTAVAYYPTLKTAFDYINNGTHKGAITIKIKHNTTEPVSAVLNASGTGAANYASVIIYPTLSGLSVSGDLATPLIDLNGADNIIIDGRVNSTGTTKDLTINNTSISATTGTSTIRFINDATNNTLKYCNLKGSETDVNSGILFFSTTTVSIGNDGNTISNNNITSSVTANRPTNAIYSAGTSGKDNSGNLISNNNIYDFLKRSAASNGILLSSNSTAWTIDGNSFYETASFIPTGSVTYNVIQISNTSGNGFIVTNNYIGGNTALCGGTAWTKTNAVNNIFSAINLNVGTTTASSVQNNTIKNFSWANSSNASWTAITLTGGNVNIGTTSGNTIGAATGTGSITVTGATSGLNVYGINISSIGTIDCQKNTIGSFTVSNGATLAGNIYGINKDASAGTTTISNNNIGSTITANSINASSASTANAQLVYGIYNAGTGTITISNNIISKIKNGTTNTTVGTSGLVNGITSLNGTITISGNTIYDLSIANANTNASNSASVCGIALNGTANPKTLSGNTIYNLSNTYASFAGNIIGLYFAGGTSANSVSANFIHSLSVSGASSTAANIYGIKIASGLTTYSNNIINLGGNTRTSVYGIYETGAASNNNNLYFNTIYIGGSLASGSTNKSYALYSAASTNVRNFRNNIFMNARSTTAGANLHFAAYFNYTASTNITLNYNDYFVSGTGSVIAYWNGANKTALPIITGQDANSLAINPNFATPGGTNFSDYYTATSLAGVSGTGILSDYEGVTRNSPPKMGALEFSQAFIWEGNTSEDFGTASNWQNAAIPPNGADFSFAATPANNCKLDANRAFNTITNAQSAKKLVVNGKQLTITGNLAFSNGAQIDATAASSIMVFSGTAVQSIPSGVFVSNTIDALTLNNSNGLTQNGDLTLTTAFTLTSGAYTIGANTLTINGAVSATSGSLTGGSTSNIIIGGSGANTTLPGVTLNNLTLNRSNGITTGGAYKRCRNTGTHQWNLNFRSKYIDYFGKFTHPHKWKYKCQQCRCICSV